MQQERPNRGFTLVELLVSLFIITVLSASLFRLLSYGSVSYGLSSQVLEAVGDLHLASNLISREIELSGFGVPEGEHSVEVSGSGSSKTLTIKGCFSRASHLVQAASKGEATLYVDDSSLFSEGDRVLIGDVELKEISFVGDGVITLSSGLDWDQPKGSTVRRIDTVEYYVSDGSLYRKVNDGSPQPVLDGVKTFDVEPDDSDAPLYTVTLVVSPGGDLGDMSISFSASRRIR